ncbi:MAG: Scr1 family TA system antitoxin-like transcriptional regulator [Pseudonocardiaceae bacterium]
MGPSYAGVTGDYPACRRQLSRSLNVLGKIRVENARGKLIAAQLEKLIKIFGVDGRTAEEPRADRQQQLTTADFRLTAVINEAALHRWVGGREVMHAQLRHLIDARYNATVEVLVLPYEAGEQSCVAIGHAAGWTRRAGHQGAPG